MLEGVVASKSMTKNTKSARKARPSSQDKASLARLEERIRTYEKEIARQQVRIAEIEAHMQHLHNQLRKQQGTKQQVKSLFNNVDRAIMQSLDKKGYARQRTVKNVVFPADSLSSKDSDELMALARIYDAQKYFHYRGLRENMKPHYRILSKVYRVTRDTSKKGVKRAYRLTKKAKI